MEESKIHADTQTPDWSQNTAAYFAGSQELVIGAYQRSKVKPAPPDKGKGEITTQTYSDPVKFNEDELEKSLIEVGGFGFELIDTTGNPKFSYIWLNNASTTPPASTTKHPTTTGTVWGAPISHITLVREEERIITSPARLKEGKEGTHLTIRGGPNNTKPPWGLHVELPANSAAVTNYFLAIEPSNHADKSLTNEFWANFRNGFKMRYGADFKGSKDWQTFETHMKADIVALLIEYNKFLKSWRRSQVRITRGMDRKVVCVRNRRLNSDGRYQCPVARLELICFSLPQLTIFQVWLTSIIIDV